jgi:hypothetical protein
MCEGSSLTPMRASRAAIRSGLLVLLVRQAYFRPRASSRRISSTAPGRACSS